MARRSDHSRKELEKLIIDKSWDIVGKNGFEGLTARKIAKAIGYAPGTIYNLFDSMDGLYLTINALTIDMLYETLSAPACNNPRKSPVNNMKCMATHYLDFARDYRPYWLMLFNLRVSEEIKDTDWYQEKVERLFTPLEELLQPYFKDTQTQKRKTAARVLWSSVHGLCFLQETGKIAVISEKKAAPDMAEYLIDTFIAGIRQKQAV